MGGFRQAVKNSDELNAFKKSMRGEYHPAYVDNLIGYVNKFPITVDVKHVKTRDDGFVEEIQIYKVLD
jgi:hypothetical protein